MVFEQGKKKGLLGRETRQRAGMAMVGRSMNGGGRVRVAVLSFLVIFLSVVGISKVAGQAATLTNITTYAPTTDIWINCGGQSNATVSGIHVFIADTNNGNYVSEGILAANTVPANNADDPYPQLLESARIFIGTSSYKIPVTDPGPVWLRLWFYPITYVQSQQTYNPSSAMFSVTANGFTLLNNITSAIIQEGEPKYLYVEYLINVQNSIVVTFKPEPNAFAFVNGLAVVSAPSGLLENSVLSVPQSTYTLNMASNAVQTMYRVNVGGSVVTPSNDSFLTRRWDQDNSYLFGAITGQLTDPVDDAIQYPNGVPYYVAPASVYGTARTLGSSGAINNLVNLTWVFPVDVGYGYYVRLHFAETVYSLPNQRVFNIYINNKTGFLAYDVVESAQGLDKGAQFKDFFVDMFNSTVDQLWLALSPAEGSSEYKDVILNGAEIFKINNTASSLQGTSVAIQGGSGAYGTGGKKSGKNTGTIIGAAVGGIAAVAVLVAGICFYCSHKSKGNAKNPSSAWLPLPLHGGNSESRTASKISTTASHKSGTGSYVSSAASNLGRYFTFSELQEATNNFDEDLLLGVGGFGKVYKAEIDDGTLVAVKRGNPRSEQGLTEFQTEIELLSKLRHRHLVSLIGYCEEHCEMILVYDYMANGPLRGHLYGTDLPPLSWKQRVEICVGAARGLHYLHTGAAQGIIHRDVKTTNILLDDNFVAKVADFGLSKTGPSLDRTHVSTAVKGSFGYLDPEYFRRQQLTEKSDVYSFGVVLMEVVCARPAINPALPREQVNIADWAMQWQKMGMLEQIIDPKLVGYINPESLKKFGETAEKCLAEQGVDRPAMGDVLWNLEYALQLQENSMENRLMEGSTSRILELPLRTPEPEEPDLTTTNHSLDSEESEDASASAVFSQLVNPRGRQSIWSSSGRHMIGTEQSRGEPPS